VDSDDTDHAAIRATAGSVSSLKSAPGLGTKVLSARLKDLEARGIIERQVEAGPPVRVAYELTRKAARSVTLLKPSTLGRELATANPPASRAPRSALARAVAHRSQ